MIDNDRIVTIVAEIETIIRGQTLLDAISVAIAVEQSFDVTLREEDIDPGRLCSPDALKATLSRLLGDS